MKLSTNWEWNAHVLKVTVYIFGNILYKDNHFVSKNIRIYNV